MRLKTDKQTDILPNLEKFVNLNLKIWIICVYAANYTCENNDHIIGDDVKNSQLFGTILIVDKRYWN